MLPTPDYQRGNVRLWCADCMTILARMEAGSVVVTDPPYGLELGLRNDKRQDRSHLGKRAYGDCSDTYEDFVSLIVPRLAMALSKAKRGAVFSGPHIQEQPKASAVGGIYCPSAIGRTCHGFKNFLPVLFYGTAPRLNEGSRHTVLQSTAIAEKNGHPCPKPLEWMTWLVETETDTDDTVIDPFMGSGTTGCSCVRLGRAFIGVEIERRYFDIAVKRIDAAFDDFALYEPVPKAEKRTLFDGKD